MAIKSLDSHKKIKSDRGENIIKISNSCKIERKLRGGGTLIRNPPIFSPDSEYIYVNCWWGVRVYSVNTGQCVKVLDTLANGDGRVISVLLVDYKTIIATRNDDGKIFLLFWDPKSAIITRKEQLVLPQKKENTKCTAMLLSPNITDPTISDLCLVLKSKNNRFSVNKESEPKYFYCVYFYSINKFNALNHPLNGTEVGYDKHKHLLSFGGPRDLRIMATVIKSKGLQIYSINGQIKKKNINAGENVTWSSVCCHPNEPSIAVGDSIGRCVLFRNPLNYLKAKTIFHWHTLPCNTIAFSPAGTTMFTGGEEHVFVKWNLENPNVKHFIPRLSAPIVHISVSNDNSLIAIANLDNGIVIVDSSHKVKCTLKELAWGIITHKDVKLFPAGLNFDSVTRSVILNSKPGHLQFYCPETENHSSVDICLQNYLTQERNKVIINADVTNIALSSDSVWMATVETRCEKEISLESHLKFWQYDIPSKRWNLNSVVDMPHSGQVRCVRFKPVTSDSYLLVTTGDDNKFRLWSPAPIDSVYKKGLVWRCEGAAGYKDLSSGPACFSQDGSLLAVAFEQIVTLWSSDPLKFKSSLSKYIPHVKQIEYGRDSCSHLLVTCSESDVTVWNLLTFSIQWKANLPATYLISDPNSCFMAVLSSANNLFIFNPLNEVPVHIENNLCKFYSKILGMTFAPREIMNHKAPQWLSKSMLYYINSYQELISLDVEDDSPNYLIGMVEDQSKQTLFSDLKKVQTSSHVKKDNRNQNDASKHQYGVVGQTAINEFLQVQCHTMAPISTMCSSLLESLALSKVPVKVKHISTPMETDDIEAISDVDEGISEAESEVEVMQTKPKNKTKVDENLSKKIKSDPMFFIDVDDQVDDIINS